MQASESYGCIKDGRRMRVMDRFVRYTRRHGSTIPVKVLTGLSSVAGDLEGPVFAVRQ